MEKWALLDKLKKQAKATKHVMFRKQVLKSHKQITLGFSANFFLATFLRLSSIPFLDFASMSSVWSTNTTVWPVAAAT